jgi:hypothetical protein
MGAARRVAGRFVAASLAVSSVLTVSGCVDPGPIDQLRETVAALSVPDEMVPTKTSPWMELDWDTVDLDQGGTALVWEGTRGIDNQTAWLVSPWEVTTPSSEVDAASQACSTWVTFVERNSSESVDADNLNDRCLGRLDRPKGDRFVASNWQTTLDGVLIYASATLVYVKRSDSYQLRYHASE